MIRLEARLFNSLSKADGKGMARQLEMTAGATIGGVVAELGLPVAEIFLVLRNGRDVTPGVYQGGVWSPLRTATRSLSPDLCRTALAMALLSSDHPDKDTNDRSSHARCHAAIGPG